MKQFPLLTVTAAVVSNKAHSFKDVFELMKTLAGLKRLKKGKGNKQVQAGPSSKIIPEIVGWVKACGFQCKTKPDSNTASSIANKYSK